MFCAALYLWSNFLTVSYFSCFFCNFHMSLTAAGRLSSLQLHVHVVVLSQIMKKLLNRSERDLRSCEVTNNCFVTA